MPNEPAKCPECSSDWGEILFDGTRYQCWTETDREGNVSRRGKICLALTALRSAATRETHEFQEQVAFKHARELDIEVFEKVVDALKKERDHLRKGVVHISTCLGEVDPPLSCDQIAHKVASLQADLAAVAHDRLMAEADVDRLASDLRAARNYRGRVEDERDALLAAVRKWIDLSRQKNINGPDGPTDRWKAAIDDLVKLAERDG